MHLLNASFRRICLTTGLGFKTFSSSSFNDATNESSPFKPIKIPSLSKDERAHLKQYCHKLLQYSEVSELPNLTVTSASIHWNAHFQSFPTGLPPTVRSFNEINAEVPFDTFIKEAPSFFIDYLQMTHNSLLLELTHYNRVPHDDLYFGIDIRYFKFHELLQDTPDPSYCSQIHVDNTLITQNCVITENAYNRLDFFKNQSEDSHFSSHSNPHDAVRFRPCEHYHQIVRGPAYFDKNNQSLNRKFLSTASVMLFMCFAARIPNNYF